MGTRSPSSPSPRRTHGTSATSSTPASDLSIQRFSAPSDPWFYLYVQNRIAEHPHPTSDAIPLPDYLFRYDRGGFWVGASAFEYFKFPFNKLTRWFLVDFLHTRMLYRAFHASGYSRNYVVQDLALPFSTAESFIDYTVDSFGIWPLWLCPLRQTRHPTLHPHSRETEADGHTLAPMLNVGLWGFGPAQYNEFLAKIGAAYSPDRIKGAWLLTDGKFGAMMVLFLPVSPPCVPAKNRKGRLPVSTWRQRVC